MTVYDKITAAGRVALRRSFVAAAEASVYALASAAGLFAACVAAGNGQFADALLGVGLGLGCVAPARGALARYDEHVREFENLTVTFFDRVEADTAAAARRLRARVHELRPAGDHGRLVADLAAAAGQGRAA
jgi:hypothetical protein